MKSLNGSQCLERTPDLFLVLLIPYEHKLGLRASERLHRVPSGDVIHEELPLIRFHEALRPDYAARERIEQCHEFLIVHAPAFEIEIPRIVRIVRRLRDPPLAFYAEYLLYFNLAILDRDYLRIR